MQTWLITGCSSGLGRGFAKAVLKSGDQVIVTARRVETLKDLVDAYPEQALALSLDVTKEEDIKNAVEKGLERFGTIDVLINNAGYGYRAAVEEGVPKEVDQLFQTNLFGSIALIKAVLPIMRKNHRGTIANVSSIAALGAALGSGYYAATKSALESISEALYGETKDLGFHVMIIEPGAASVRNLPARPLRNRAWNWGTTKRRPVRAASATTTLMARSRAILMKRAASLWTLCTAGRCPCASSSEAMPRLTANRGKLTMNKAWGSNQQEQTLRSNHHEHFIY